MSCIRISLCNITQARSFQQCMYISGPYFILSLHHPYILNRQSHIQYSYIFMHYQISCFSVCTIAYWSAYIYIPSTHNISICRTPQAILVYVSENNRLWLFGLHNILLDLMIMLWMPRMFEFMSYSIYVIYLCIVIVQHVLHKDITIVI